MPVQSDMKQLLGASAGMMETIEKFLKVLANKDYEAAELSELNSACLINST